MRAKDEILRDAKTDIANQKASYPMSYWLRYRELEVLIDIRDILAAHIKTPLAISKAMAKNNLNAL